MFLTIGWCLTKRISSLVRHQPVENDMTDLALKMGTRLSFPKAAATV
jgi:hypothetical protein